jgi:hypothetical protein
VRALSNLALALVLAFSSAAAEKPKPAGTDYFPLRVGDSWSYRNTSGDGEYSLTVVREEEQPDGSARYLVEMVSGVKVHSWFSKHSGWVLLHEERYPEHEGLEAKYEPARQYLQNPLVAGGKWDWKGKDYTQVERNEKHRVAGFEKITVPAGKFRAMKVVSQIEGGATPMTKTSWYAEGVGLIKSTTEGGQIKYGWELADYSFKKKSKESD